MPIRERIEAQLRARDAARFKQAFDKAAEAVGHLERQEVQATAQSALMEQILDAVEEQTYETTAAIMILSGQIDELGDEMTELAAKAAAANAVMKKSGSNAVFLGKSWAFWKDRLSLTRSELWTTAATISSYLSPAIIALGSSFAYAAVGGGGVAAAGMSSLLLGLAGIVSIASPVHEGIKKITKAQEQLNVTIDQYGAASSQASRANARLYAIIENNGGLAVAQLLDDVNKLKDSWKGMTAPGQADYIDILRRGVTAGGEMAPLAASISNQIMHALRSGVIDGLKDLTGGEARATLRSLGDIFKSSIGPGIRGSMNLLIIFSRVIRASAPWVKRLAAAWERTTKSWRDRATMGRVTDFMNEAVTHTRAWWQLFKQLGRTAGLVLKGSRREGLELLLVITGLVTEFNDWLEKMEDTGKVDRFFDSYINSLHDVAWALQNPMEALDKYMPAIVAGIDKYLPQLMDVIANNLAEHGPTAARIFLEAFINAGAWSKFLTVAFFAYKFGFFGLLGKRVAGPFAAAFVAQFIARFAVLIGAGSVASASLSTAMTSAGTAAGAAMGAAAGVALVAGLAAALTAWDVGKTLKDYDKEWNTNMQGGKPVGKQIWDWIKGDNGAGNRDNGWLGSIFKGLFTRPGGKAAGGMIFPGQTRWVGEQGPELARVGPGGAMITSNEQSQALNNPIVDIPDLTSAIRLVSHVSVQLDRREIARAVDDQRAYDNARRGSG